MAFESKVMDIFADADKGKILNPDEFIKSLHLARKRSENRKKRFISGIISSAFILMIGILSYLNTDNYAVTSQIYDQYTNELGMSPDMQETYIEDLALYLLDDTDELWSTVMFLYESEFISIIN